jgi:hypothetical protein
MNIERLCATMLFAVLLAVAGSQVCTVGAETTRNFTLYGSYL